jgi:DDE superfamily endonuclease
MSGWHFFLYHQQSRANFVSGLSHRQKIGAPGGRGRPARPSPKEVGDSRSRKTAFALRHPCYAPIFNRRGVAGAQPRRCAGDDAAGHRRDDPVSRRAVAGRGARCARRRADGQGRLWHTAGEPRVPENLSLVFLPPYSPELNPIERLWLHLRDNRLSHCVFHTTEEIIDSCCQAWKWLLAETGPHPLAVLASVARKGRHLIRSV